MNYIINHKDELFLKSLTKKEIFEKLSSGQHFAPPILLLKEITIDESVCNTIIKIINQTRILIPIYESPEAPNQNYNTKFAGKVESIIFSLADKVYYEQLSFIEFLSLMLLRLTQSHAFENGNKRTGLLTFWLLSTSVGLEFNFTSTKEQINFWESLLLTCALQSANNSETDFIQEIISKLTKVTFYKQETINDLGGDVISNNDFFIQSVESTLSKALPIEIIDTLKTLSTK